MPVSSTLNSPQSGGQNQNYEVPPGDWIARWMPVRVQPYLRLARLDRLIGVWLLLFPCLWGVGLAGVADRRAYPDPQLLLLFIVGAFLMRSAGCAYNDYIDRDIDARVARTANRPIPAGQITPVNALIFASVLSVMALVVLLQMNSFTIWMGIASLAIVGVYPFLKRMTDWPQLGLGLAFNWGALIGWSAVMGSIGWPALLLYAGSVCWTIGYDTIYAHQDAVDDEVVGVRSTALAFKTSAASFIGMFYSAAVVLWLAAGFMAGAHLIFVASVILASLQLSWQAVSVDIHDPKSCLRRFRSNRDVGVALLLGLVADMALSWFAGLS